MTDAKGRVTLRGIRKRFGSFHALKGIDLDIEPQEFFALLGPSGSGKSSTLRVIAGLELSDEGLAYTNTCQAEINFRYCFTTTPGTGLQNCETIALAPNETSHSLFDEYRAANADGVHEYACEAPYLPVRIQSYTDRHVDIDACRLDPENP